MNRSWASRSCSCGHARARSSATTGGKKITLLNEIHDMQTSRNKPRQGEAQIQRAMRVGKTRNTTHVVARVMPNPSLKRSPYGRPPWARLRYSVHFLSPAQGVQPPVPA